MSSDFASGLTPRQRGLAMLISAAACVLLNLAIMRSTDEYYVVLFPLAGMTAAAGGVQLVTGASPEGLRKPTIARALVGLALVGLCMGLYANHLVGSR